MNIYRKCSYSYDLWNILGSFGEFNTEVSFENNIFHARNEHIDVTSEIIKYDNGVCVRKGKVKNISENEISLNTLSLKFTLDGGEYEVYSQSNFWQNESEGKW